MQNQLFKSLRVTSITLLLLSAPVFAALPNGGVPNGGVPNDEKSYEELPTKNLSDIERPQEKRADHKTIKPFIAKYDLLKKSDSVGEAIRKLNYSDDNLANYSYRTDANWFIFNDIREETSITSFDNKIITPTHYLFERKGTGKDKKYEWSFDVENDLATDLKKGKQLKVKFPENIQDKLSFQLQLRLDLIKDSSQKEYSYPVISTSGSIKEYIFENEGEEILTLPYGEIKAIKLKREVKDKKKVTFVWFAPELNYLLVQLYQMKNGKAQFNILLKTVDTL
jgi:hypothetical protein